jgi:signal peptidase I
MVGAQSLEAARQSLEAARETHRLGGERLARALGIVFRYALVALATGLLLRLFVVQPFGIPSGSMAPTLKAGDFILVDKTAYGWRRNLLPFGDGAGEAGFPGVGLRAVPPGDVIVFAGPGGRDFVKRVIATGGDRVAMVDGVLLLNGVAVPCRRLGSGRCLERLPNGAQHVVRTARGSPLADMAETIVPPGHYFVLGDNRGASADSRLARSIGGLGFVPDADIAGRAAAIFFSADGGIRWGRLGQRIG